MANNSLANLFMQALQAGLRPDSKQSTLISPVAENDTLNDPGKLNYVAQNQAQEAAAKRFQQTVAGNASPTPYPAFQFNPSVANAAPTKPPQQAAKAVLGADTQTPTPISAGGSYYQWTPEWAKSVLDELAKKYNIPSDLLSAQIWHESGFNPQARGYNKDQETGKVLSTDRGIAQINDKAYPNITDAQADDPNFALNWIASTMAEKRARLGDWGKALSEYNTGNPNAGFSNGYVKGVLQSIPNGSHYTNNQLMQQAIPSYQTPPSPTPVTRTPVATSAQKVLGAQTPPPANHLMNPVYTRSFPPAQPAKQQNTAPIAPVPNNQIVQNKPQPNMFQQFGNALGSGINNIGHMFGI